MIIGIVCIVVMLLVAAAISAGGGGGYDDVHSGKRVPTQKSSRSFEKTYNPMDHM